MKVLWLAPLGLINKDSITKQPATWVIALAKSLVKKNLHLTIVSVSSEIDDDILDIRLDNLNFTFVKVPKKRIDFLTFYQIRFFRVRKYLKKIVHNFDILHIHGTEHQFSAISYGLKIPKIVSIQGLIHEYLKHIPFGNLKQRTLWFLHSFYEKKYITKNDNFSCRTHWDSSIIKSLNANSKIYMIWEIIREDFFNDNFSLRKENILFVGGKNPIKGLKELLEAYNSSIQSLGYKLIVLGECTTEEVQAIIDNKGLLNIDIKNIDCRGRVSSDEMVSAYKDSYCLVHPTYIDNSPNSVCEAQLSGLPVIATNVGGVSSLIDNMNTGLLIDNSSKAIEIAVEKLHQDISLRDNISSNSKAIARERHNPEAITNQTIKMYTEIIKLSSNMVDDQ
jgi:glycosyltransferase involved in cell wall biosynthesis